MKNANSRFVRVLAIALVVLMVVPAALVGCGSNKANNAAISEALAAAEAAKKEAEEAKAAAEAAAQKALEEANKKAEEALKAAEEAQKALEEAMKNSTAAPTTTAPAPTEDLKVVSEYAYKVLNDEKLDFLKTYAMYAFGATEEDIEAGNVVTTPNPEYSSVDFDAMVELYGTTRLAIQKANTVDYINQLVANFIAAIEAVPTYVERVIDAYEAIDFASNYDVIDVVYANAFADAATLTTDAIAELTKYGEDEIDVLSAIATEYYRYTGVVADYASVDTSEIEVLYDDMYADAADIVAAVVALVDDTAAPGIKLDVTALGYASDIDDAVAAAIKMYTKWNNDYFVKAKDTELVKYYEAFRQAFVGEAYIINFEGDYVWDALKAFEARATELLAAAAEYKDTFKSALTKVAGYSVINYWKQADQVATVKAALDAWKTKYNFKDAEDGTLDANVTAIIGAETYDDYAANALVVEYFVYLEKTASAVNVADFVKAYNSDLDEDDAIVTFDFAKYGSAVASALDWYFGKVKNEVRANGFIDVKPSTSKGFEALADATYGVEALIDAENVNIVKIFDNLFDLDIADDDAAAFDSMLTAYDALLAKKKAADTINKNIAEALEKGAKIDVLDDVVDFIGEDVEAVLNPEDDDNLYITSAGSIGTWAAGYIAKGDVNYLNMIDWANVDALYANYKASTAEIEKVAIKIALEYIAWKGAYNAEDGELTFGDKVFEDLEPLSINIFSYDMIKEIVETYEAIQNIEKGNTPVVVPVNEDENLNITLETVTDYCYEMLTYFYDIVDSLEAGFYNEIYKGYPFFSATTYASEGALPHSTHQNAWNAPIGATAMYEIISNGRTFDSKVADGVMVVMNAGGPKFRGYSNVQLGDNKFSVTVSDVTYTVTTVSYQYAVYSVNPNDYAIKNSSGVVTGFDTNAYQAAVLAKVASMHKTYLDSYIKKAAASEFTSYVETIAAQSLNTGLWTIEDEIIINGDVYDFSVNVDKTGKAWQLVVTDADGDAVNAAAIAVKYDGKDYVVSLTPAVADGKFVITPSVALAGGGELAITVYDLLDDIDADDTDALVYDVRDYVDAIAANLDKITTIPFLGNKASNLNTFTAAQLKTLFDAEAKNDFWTEFNLIKARLYGSNTATFDWKFGNYITNFSALDAEVQTKLNAISKMAYEKAKGMTPDANTIEDVLKVFNTFKIDVKNVLNENEITFITATVNGYEQITID